MDPKQCLKECLALANEINFLNEQYDVQPGLYDAGKVADLGRELADRFSSLNKWMEKNGFSPWK
jgi:hypothetical protein